MNSIDAGVLKDAMLNRLLLQFLRIFIVFILFLFSPVLSQTWL